MLSDAITSASSPSSLRIYLSPPLFLGLCLAGKITKIFLTCVWGIQMQMKDRTSANSCWWNLDARENLVWAHRNAVRRHRKAAHRSGTKSGKRNLWLPTLLDCNPVTSFRHTGRHRKVGPWQHLIALEDPSEKTLCSIWALSTTICFGAQDGVSVPGIIFFSPKEKIAMATSTWKHAFSLKLVTHHPAMLICWIYIVINVKRHSAIWAISSWASRPLQPHAWREALH